MRILVLNAGSSSLKFHLFEDEKRIGHGQVERVADMKAALEEAFRQLSPALEGGPVEAVGHRFVHGGDLFHSAVVLTDAVEQQLESISEMAPLHMPGNLAAYRAAREHLPEARQVACFDTSFHHRMPPHAYRYAVPEDWWTVHKIRRYGFHGISHRYVSERYRELCSGRARKVISCHLGNGCSLAAIVDGVSIDTSMGFTPLEGLVMGSRSGDIDPGAVLQMVVRGGVTAQDAEGILNKESGLKGLSGISGDVRDLRKAAAGGDERGALALDLFAYRVRKYIGAYAAAMNGLDSLLFTAGIGEHDAPGRKQICNDMSFLGIEIDDVANQAANGEERRINKGPVDIWVIPTNEELLIARDTLALLAGG